MSAFIVSDKTITAILQGAKAQYPGDTFDWYWSDELRNAHEQDVADELLKQNYRSVNVRYNEQNIQHRWKRCNIPDLTPVQILKALDCYDYQACETDDYNTTEAAAIIQTIRLRTIRLLSGYDKAAWDL